MVQEICVPAQRKVPCGIWRVEPFGLVVQGVLDAFLLGRMLRLRFCFYRVQYRLSHLRLESTPTCSFKGRSSSAFLPSPRMPFLSISFSVFSFIVVFPPLVVELLFSFLSITG